MKTIQERRGDVDFAEQMNDFAVGNFYRSQEARRAVNRRKDAARLARLAAHNPYGFAATGIRWDYADVGDYRATFGPVWQAKALARRVGLIYWPALVRAPDRGEYYKPAVRSDGQGFVRAPLSCNPRAFIAAERVLARRHGYWNPAEGCRGGWDSKGYYGVSPKDVTQMWFSAGCRDSRKFRLQVTTRLVAKKGDSAAWFKHYAIGYKWLENKKWLFRSWSRKAIAALGRLSWRCRWAAINGLPDDGSIVRIRHLNWTAVRAVSEAIRADDKKAMLRYLPPKAAANAIGIFEPNCSQEYWQAQLLPTLCPAYTQVSWETAQRVARGESPVAISGGKLNRREAHEWLKAGGRVSPEEWLSDRISRSTGTQFHHRSMKVLRWLERLSASKDRWEAVVREREAPGPGGVMRRFTALQILDEIADDDIQTGRDSVDAVLRRAAERLGEAFLTAASKDHRLLCPTPTWANRLGKYCRVLRTPAELVQEGRDLDHCVGGYANAVEAGQCWILSIRSPAGQSTVELSSDLRVRQHCGRQNSDPPRRHTQILAAIIRRIK